MNADETEVETPSSSYGDRATASKRVLVGYATRTGATVGVAQAIGETLGERGLLVEVKPMKDRPALEGYDAVVLGSAINGGRWLPEAVGFVESNASALAGVPVSLFCVHAMNTRDTEKAQTKREAYLDNIRAAIEPVTEGYFAGIGPSGAEASAFSRWAFRAFGGDVEGDGRDWDKIRAWAEGLAV